MGDDHCKSAEVHELPTQEYLCIEYPGYVKNIENIFEMFGGIQNITQTHQEQQRQLSISFRPHDQFSHSIFCDRVQTASFLLKVVKNDCKIIKGEIVGLIPFTYRCEGLADFQYFPKDANDDLYLDSSESLFGDITGETDVPPPIFSKSDIPYSYNFKANITRRKAAFDEYKVSELQKDDSNQGCDNPSIISFDSPHLPQSPPEATTSAKKELMETLGHMFNDRPIWSRISIQCIVPSYPAAILSASLHQVAYSFYNGPWRGLYIKLGHDPRKNPEDRRYQIIDFRCPEEMTRGKIPSNCLRYPTEKPRRVMSTRLLDKLDEKSLNSNKQKNMYKTIRELEYKFLKPPGHRQTLYILSDLELPGLDDLISLDPSDECKHETGWLKPHILKEIRKLMSERLPLLVRDWDSGRVNVNLDEEYETFQDDPVSSISPPELPIPIPSLLEDNFNRVFDNKEGIPSFLENIFKAAINISEDEVEAYNIFDDGSSDNENENIYYDEDDVDEEENEDY